MAKDQADRGTRDFVTAASAAERQRAFTARMKARGYKRTTVWQHQPTWEAGYAAGLAGEDSRPPAGTEDRLAWMSGYIEGAGD